MGTELNIFQEYWQRFCRPWYHISFVLYFVFVIVVFGGLGVIFAATYDIDSPTKIGYVASNLSTYAIALLVPSIITMILSSHKISNISNKVSSTIIVVVLLVGSGFLLHFSNTHKEYSIWTAIIIAIFAWLFWVIVNSDNNFLKDKSFYGIIERGYANHNKDKQWDEYESE